MPRKNLTPLPDHRDCEILTGLTVDNVPRDNSIGLARRYRKGGNIWKPDDRSDSIFFLESGQVAIVSSDREGREVVFGVIEAGEPFGELCFCAPKKHFRRETYARAVTESEVLEIKLDDFMSYLQENRDALRAFTFTFCCRLSDCQSRLEFLAYRGAEERLGRVLLHLAATRGKPSDTQTGQTILPISHDELAQMAAMSRPHVTVTMGKLRRRGLVQYGRNNPLTVDVERLKTLYAFEGRCFVLAAGLLMKAADLPSELMAGTDLEMSPEKLLLRGGSCLIAPDGNFVVEPVFDEEKIIAAELDLTQMDKEKMTLDVSGHYSRPDVFDFRVNRNPRRN